MNLVDDLIDSIRYTSSGLSKVIIIGILLFLLDQIDELSWIGPYASIVEYALIFVSFILGFLVAGYIFRIIEETIHGSQKPPKFNKLKEMMVHGVKEIAVAFVYAFIPLVLFFMVTGNFDVYGVRDVLFVGLNFTLEEGYLDTLIILELVLGLILDALLIAAILNMAHNDGSFRSGFDMKNIILKIKKIGIVKILVVDILIISIFCFDWFILTDTLSEGFSWLGFLISQLLISPFIIVFTARMMGLIDE